MQLSTLYRKSFKGFTLIELLVVIAIIGLLSTIVAAPVQSARKKAKDTKKIAEIKQMDTALANFANDNGQFPDAQMVSASGTSITGLTPTYIPALPTSMGVTNTVAARDKMYYISYWGIPPGTSIGKFFGFHMASTLEVYNTVLADDADCWGVVSSSSQQVSGNKNGGPCIAYISRDPVDINTAANIGGSTTPVVGGAGGYPLIVTGGATITAATAVQQASTTFIFATTAHVSHPRQPAATADMQGYGTNETASSTCSTIDLCIYDVSQSY